jgi:hypothetical protein
MTKHYSTTVLRYYGTTVLRYYGTTVLWYYSTTVLRYYGTTVLRYYGTTVLRYYSTTVLQYYGTTVLRYYGTMVLWYYGTMVLQYYSGSPSTFPIASQHTRAFQLIAAILALHTHTHNTPQAKVLPSPQRLLANYNLTVSGCPYIQDRAKSGIQR